MPPDLQGKYDGCQPQVMSGVVSLMHLKLPRSIHRRLFLLHQHAIQT